MDIKIKDTIILDDGIEYVIVGKVNYQSKIYYYLVAVEAPFNLKFCSAKEGNNNILIISEDKEINNNLLPLFAEQAEVLLNEIITEQL